MSNKVNFELTSSDYTKNSGDYRMPIYSLLIQNRRQHYYEAV